MKLVKTYAENSLGDERFSNLIVLAIEKEHHKDPEKVVDVFVKQHKNGTVMLM